MNRTDLSQIVAGIPIPALLIAANARVQVLNAPAIAVFGADVEGRNYVTALRQPAILRAIEDAGRTQTTASGHYTVSGQTSDLRFRVTAAPLGAGAVSGILVCLEDVTPLYEAGQMRRDFVANVSHELRTPLTALLGFIDTLQGPARDDPKARDRFLGVMAREARRMNRLVGDLLSLSRVEFSEKRRPDARIKLSDVLNASRAALAPETEQGAVQLDLAAEEDDMVLGEADQLRQVFANLIENALKYGGTDRPVEVRLSIDPQDLYLRCRAVRVDVRDHGPGIAAHHIPRLTERFYRVDEHRSRELGGTGLGLAIVKHIVHRHRGRLTVTSDLGAGSCFSVIIPAADPE